MCACVALMCMCVWSRCLHVSWLSGGTCGGVRWVLARTQSAARPPPASAPSSPGGRADRVTCVVMRGDACGCRRKLSGICGAPWSPRSPVDKRQLTAMPPDVRGPPETGTGTFEAPSDVCGGPLTGTNIDTLFPSFFEHQTRTSEWVIFLSSVFPSVMHQTLTNAPSSLKNIDQHNFRLRHTYVCGDGW